MNIENIKNAIRESVVQNFMEAAKFARRGAEKQRPKSWNKGVKSGSEKRKMREEGKRETREMHEGWQDDESAAQERLIRSGMVSPDTGEGYKGISSKTKMGWATQNVVPLLKKHGMEEHANAVTEHGYPLYAHAVSHPAFAAFARDFIDLHTKFNRQHWKAYGKASPFHWPAISRANKDLEQLSRRSAGGDLSEGAEELEAELEGNREPHQIDLLLKRIRADKAAREAAQQQEVNEERSDVAGASQDDATARAYEEQDQEKALQAHHAARTHVTPEEEAEMHGVYTARLDQLKRASGGKPSTSDVFTAIERARAELENRNAARIGVLSDPNYPAKGMSAEDRLLRIHQLQKLNDEVYRVARKQHLGYLG